MVLKVAPADRAQLKRVQKAFRQLPREVKSDFQKYQRASLNPIWREELAGRATSGSTTQAAVFRTGSRTKAGAPASLIAGASNRALSGGLIPSQHARAFEFGSRRQGKFTKYNRRSRNGGTHTVTRRAAQQMPSYRRGGWVVYPAFSKALPRIASLHVQTLVRKVYDAVEGR